MRDKEISAATLALHNELKKSIIKKVELIKENITLEKGSDKDSYLQMLIMIDEDLDDVLLNWEYSSINPKLSFSDDLDDFDEDDF